MYFICSPQLFFLIYDYKANRLFCLTWFSQFVGDYIIYPAVFMCRRNELYLGLLWEELAV